MSTFMQEHALSIFSTMSDGHRRCDELFAAIEERADKRDWDGAQRAFQEFSAAFELHLRQEEEGLFPAFEARTGGPIGPTVVMRHEHAQMRAVVIAIGAALTARATDDVLGHSESIMGYDVPLHQEIPTVHRRLA